MNGRAETPPDSEEYGNERDTVFGEVQTGMTERNGGEGGIRTLEGIAPLAV